MKTSQMMLLARILLLTIIMLFVGHGVQAQISYPPGSGVWYSWVGHIAHPDIEWRVKCNWYNENAREYSWAFEVKNKNPKSMHFDFRFTEKSDPVTRLGVTMHVRSGESSGNSGLFNVACQDYSNVRLIIGNIRFGDPDPGPPKSPGGPVNQPAGTPVLTFPGPAPKKVPTVKSGTKTSTSPAKAKRRTAKKVPASTTTKNVAKDPPATPTSTAQQKAPDPPPPAVKYCSAVVGFSSAEIPSRYQIVKGGADIENAKQTALAQMKSISSSSKIMFEGCKPFGSIAVIRGRRENAIVWIFAADGDSQNEADSGAMKKCDEMFRYENNPWLKPCEMDTRWTSP